MEVQAEAIWHLTGAAKYQEQVKAAKDEFMEEGGLYNEESVPIELMEGVVCW